MAFLRTLKQGFHSSLALASLLTAFISNNSTAQNCTPPPTGLVAWWPGEGNAVDNVAGHNGSVSNGVTFVSGVVGQAFSFDGVHTIQVPNDPAFNFGPTSPMSVELWAYLTGSQPTAHFIGKRVGCDGDNFNYQMAYDPENGLQFGCSNLNGVYTGIPMPTNIWTHLAGTFDGTTFRFYINGSLVASNNGVLGPVNSEPLVIGGSGTCGVFEGLIDEPSIYNRALSAAEIQSIYDSGSAGKCPVVFSNQPPVIVAQPASQTIGVGSNVTFFVTATGAAPLQYQWLFNNTNIPGALGSSYTLANVQPSDAGNYSVVITNIAGITTSSNALLTVTGNTNVAPIITSQPASQVVNAGTNVTFSVVATGTAPLHYQWRFNNTNIAGATSNILTRLNVQTTNSGNYSVVITNIAGGTISSNALLTVSNVAPTITSQPASQIVNAGTNVTFRVIATGTVPMFYQWRLNSTNIAGATSSILTRLNVQTTSSGNYSVIISNIAGGTISSNALLTVIGNTNVAPAITSQPASQTVNAGTNVTFSVVATGTDPLSYQWLFNNTNIAGATSSIFSLSNVQTTDSGSYAVVINNIAGTTFSSNAFLTVIGNTNVAPTITTQPQNQAVAVGQTATFSVDVAGTVPLLYQWRFNTTNIPGAQGSSLTLSNVQPSNAGNYSVVITNIAGIAVSSNALLTVISNPNVAPTIVFVSPTNNMNFGSISNVGVYARVADVDGVVTNLDFFWGTNLLQRFSGTLTDNGGIYGFLWTNLSTGSYSITASATDDSGAVSTTAPLTFTVGSTLPTITSQPASQTVNAGTNVTFSVVATGTAPLSYQWLFNNTNIAGATSSVLTRLNVQPTNAGNYSVVITNIAGTTISSNALLTVIGNTNVAPTITSQPASQTVNAGSNVTFRVVATGTAPLRYQWLFNNTNIAGATSSILSRLNVQTTNAGNYSVVITNIAGTAVSSNALLTVIPSVAPTITSQPQNQSVAVGQIAIFTVTATGTSPLQYQWLFNGSIIPLGRGSSLIISNVQPSNAGNYSVVITNIAGKVTSSNALLTVITPVAITAQPQSLAVTEGNSATFTVSTTGSGPLNYQWFYNNSPLDSQTNASLILASVADINAGPYSVSISNSLGSVTSSNATLTVNPAVCVPAPAGLVSWWPGEANARDLTDDNNGTLDGALDFAPGKVGQAFAFNGTDADVKIPASPDLNVGAGDGFSIDAWINPSDITTQRPLVEWNSGSWGVHFWISVPVSSTGAGPGCLYANLSDIDGQGHTITSPAGTIVPFTFQHVALTYDKTSGQAVLYVNGTVVAQENLGIFTPSTMGDLWLGVRPAGDAAGTRFIGSMDEVDLFNRALPATEIQSIYNASFAGKCRTAPLVVTQPASQTVAAGDSATFTVETAGTGMLEYQWKFAGEDIPGATTTSLVISNVQSANAGIYSVLISSAIGSVSSSNATLTVDHAPVANPQSLAVNEDSSLSITLIATDEDADAISYTASAPSHGTLTGTAPNLVYQPAPGYYGPDAFTFTANDGFLNSTDATITIDVRFVNHAPSFTKGPDLVVLEDSTAQNIANWASNISPGAANEASQQLHFIVSNSNAGLFSAQPAIDPSGTLAYSLAPNANGSATVTVQLQDDGGTGNGGVDLSTVQTFTITVLPVNDPPVAQSQSAALNEDTTAAITLTATDVENDPLTYVVLTAPAHGTLTGNGANLVYHPNTNYFGPDAFTFKANDGQADSGVATVTITVNPVNDAPVAVARITPLFVLSTNDTDLVVIAPDSSEATVIFDGSLSTDVENDPLQFTWLDEGKTNILGQTMVATNTLSVGTNIVSLIVNDGTDTSTNTIQVQVITPVDAVSNLAAVLQEVDLGGIDKHPFFAALNRAKGAFGRGELGDGVAFLEQFQNRVITQTSPAYNESVARLIYIANEIIQAVTPPPGNQ